jgi:hypothetical protein
MSEGMTLMKPKTTKEFLLEAANENPACAIVITMVNNEYKILKTTPNDHVAAHMLYALNRFVKNEMDKHLVGPKV